MLVEVHTVNIPNRDMRVNTLDVPVPKIFILSQLIYEFKGPRNQIKGMTGSGVISENAKKV